MKFFLLLSLSLASLSSIASVLTHSNCLLTGVVSSNGVKESHLKEVLESRGYILRNDDDETPGLFVTSFAITKRMGLKQLTFAVVDNTVFPSKEIKSSSKYVRDENVLEKHYDFMNSIPSCKTK